MPNDMPDNDNPQNEDREKESTAEVSYEQLLEKLKAAEKKAEQHWDRILRIQAENDNLLRRSERDVANAHKYALEKFVGDLVPIVDSLELAIVSVPENSQDACAAVVEGINLTLKMFYNTLEKFGIKQVNPVGQPFNPEFEQAISMQYDPKVKAGNVISVLQKGYTLNNRLVRPALVVVAKGDE